MINNPKILIIDDIEDNILTLKALLRKNFDPVILLSATSGDKGIELAKSTVPDIILLDILMPDKDGFDVCATIKETSKLSGIPVVFITAMKESKSVKLKALRSGAEGFLTKPIDEMTLVATMHAMLKVREAEIMKINERERLALLVKQQTHSLEKELLAKEKVEKRLKDSEDRYIGLVENLDSGVVIHGPNTEIITCNQKACELLSLSLNQMLGKDVMDPYWQFVDEEGHSLPLSKFPVSIVKNTMKPLKNYVLGIIGKKGATPIWVSCNGHPRYAEDGTFKEFVISFLDVTSQIESRKKLEYSANNDHLTGLFNRRYYDTYLENLNKENSFPVTIAVADINGLKLVNDAFGHLHGDKMLCKAADVIKESVKETDIVARIGGDEFGIIMPNTSHKESNQIIANIHKQATKIVIQSIQLSISIGHFTKTTNDIDLFEVSRTAEDIMYRQKLIEIPSMRSNAIETILTTLYEKDQYSEFHSRSVSNYAEKLARAHGLEEQLINEIKTAGLLHDIGKIIIPSNIIEKLGALTPKEREVINTHPEIGYRILNSSSQLREISRIVLNHHERWDGTGYPRNIAGDEIPIESRIISVCDAFDAMTSERTYRTIFTKEEAKQEIIDNSGTQFDPIIVKTFLENFETITK